MALEKVGGGGVYMLSRRGGGRKRRGGASAKPDGEVTSSKSTKLTKLNKAG